MAECQDCISREAALKNLCYKCNNEFSDEPCEPADCFIVETIKSLPTSDAAQVIQGEWIHTGHSNSTGPIIRCSSCGKCINPSTEAVSLSRQNVYPDFCEHCGSKNKPRY